MSLWPSEYDVRKTMANKLFEPHQAVNDKVFFLLLSSCPSVMSDNQSEMIKAFISLRIQNHINYWKRAGGMAIVKSKVREKPNN